MVYASIKIKEDNGMLVFTDEHNNKNIILDNDTEVIIEGTDSYTNKIINGIINYRGYNFIKIVRSKTGVILDAEKRFSTNSHMRYGNLMTQSIPTIINIWYRNLAICYYFFGPKKSDPVSTIYCECLPRLLP